MRSYYQYDTEATGLLQGARLQLVVSDEDNKDDDFAQKDDIENRSSHTSRKLQVTILLTAGVAAAFYGLLVVVLNKTNSDAPPVLTTDYLATHKLSKGIVEHIGNGGHHKKKKKKDEEKSIRIWRNVVNNHKTVSYLSQWSPPPAQLRCDFVMNEFAVRDEWTSLEDLKERYLAQSVDPNVFYRATAHLFWRDFAGGHWDHDFGGKWSKDFTQTFLLHNDPDSHDSDDDEMDESPKNKQQLDGADLTAKSVWTWVTGDQHLSNFGAWRNRHGDIVFSVNDFDEAAIFNFQVDVIRIAVSICNHAIGNGLTEEEVNRALLVFTESYVQTVLNYQDNEEALTYELTQKTAYGKLGKFLNKIDHKKSHKKLMVKFTTHDPLTKKRHFIKGPVDVPHDDTHLASVQPEVIAEIKKAFTKERYGATMMKLGWSVPEWDDDFFKVMDVAERVGSGIGSYGVDRYYVLMKGHDGLTDHDGGEDGPAIILDVKYQPTSAVTRVLNEENAAWYNVRFPNEAARVVEAQRRLTSYTDPYTGWITLPNLDPNSTSFEYGEHKPFSIRQRGPWKASPELDEEFDDPEDFNEFVSQIAAATATSHVRGSVAKAPGDFKHVIGAVLGGSEHKRVEWGNMMAKIAHAYRKQVLLDFECFRDFVKEHYGDAAAV